MTIQTRLVEYTHDDVVLVGFLAWNDDSDQPRPAVAIAHTWVGRSEFEESKAVALAEQGYAAFALDLYGKGVNGSTVEENTALMTPLMEDRVMLQARMNLAVAALQDQPEVDGTKVAAIGYCLGGLGVLDLARSGSDVLGVVSFHGLFFPPEGVPNKAITAKVLCLHGYDDPMADPESMTSLASELSASGADWQIHAYGNTLHAFTNPGANNLDMGTIYSADADRRSGQALNNFLAELF
ncbi:MAG: dienelactone hydrolase [Halieaceae bacterium]|jgi:dienelactone hydrolase